MDGSLLAISLLSSGKSKVGLITTSDFNSIRVTFSIIGAITSRQVYYAEVLVPGNLTAPNCNTMTSMVQNAYPATVTTGTSGFVGVDIGLLGNVFSGVGNVVDADVTSNKATITLPAGSVAYGAHIGVRLAGTQKLPAGYFAGFEIDNNQFLNASALSGITVSLLKHDNVTGVETVVTSGTGTGSIISAQLLGGGKNIIGVVSTGDFDEVRINFNQLAGVNLGSTDVYRAVIQNNCDKPLECNKSYILKVNEFGAVINGARTGVSGLASVSVNDGVAHPWNLVDNNTSNYATLKSTANVGVVSSISVRTPANTYPKGTVAGFTIKDNSSLVGLNLFKSIKITTYLNGAPIEEQESATAGALIDLNLFWSGSGFRNIGFVTTKPFDEIRISTGGLADALATNLDVYYAYVDTRFVRADEPGFNCVKVKLNPDVNAGYINKPILGNVKTNDVVLPGTKYGTPVATTGAGGGVNPGGASITMNNDGTYTFTATTPGVYNYNVPILKADGTPTGETTLLTITVLDGTPGVLNNPVANTDLAETKVGTPVTIDVKANDRSVNPGNTLGDPMVTTVPVHGTTSVSGGKVIYTPATGFVGTDEFTYEVCETPSAKCAKAKVFVTVQPDGSYIPNSTDAADDYNNTKPGQVATGNVKLNDTDPEGDGQTVTAQNVTDSRGNFVLASDGSYTFTPAAGFSGTAAFVYETTDSKGAKAYATLYVTVGDDAGLNTKPDNNVAFKGVPVSGNVSTNDKVPAGSNYGTPTATNGPDGNPNPGSEVPVMQPNGTYTFTGNTPGSYSFMVPVCAPSGSPCVSELLTITVIDPAVTNNTPVAMNDVSQTKSGTAVDIPVKDNDKASNPGKTLGAPTVKDNPAHGTATVNPDGTIKYTPTPGYVGKDSFTYTVCEDGTSPANCASAEVVVDVVPASGGTNTTSAADDYVQTTSGNNATGNVKDNDHDAEGDTQTVTPQNNVVVPNVGTFNLLSNGNYTFTPAANFTGTAAFPYKTCDAGSPQACANATLYVMVEKVPDLTPSVDISSLNFQPSDERDFVVDLFEIAGKDALSSVQQIQFRVKVLSGFDITVPGLTLSSVDQPGISGSSNVGGAVPNENGNWTFKANSSNITVTSKPGINITANGMAQIGFHIKRKDGVPKNTSQNITVTIINGSGGETNFDNNISVTTVTTNNY